MLKVSVVIPVYNESRTLPSLLERIEKERVHEIIVSDDGSTDETLTHARAAALKYGNIRIITEPSNRGKGSALRSGFALVSGDVAIVQDADLEYDPADYGRLVAAFENPNVSVVYGSRFIGPNYSSFLKKRRAVNWVLTTLTNQVAGTALTDVHTGYKAFRSHVIKGMPLKEERFGFCTEVTLKALRAGHVILEVPIGYSPRSRKDGKKIGLRDGLSVLWCIMKYGILK